MAKLNTEPPRQPARTDESRSGPGFYASIRRNGLVMLGAKRETMVDRTDCFYVRRSFDGGWNYFIANRSGTNFDGWITLGRSAKSVVTHGPDDWQFRRGGVSAEHGKLNGSSSAACRRRIRDSPRFCR